MADAFPLFRYSYFCSYRLHDSDVFSRNFSPYAGDAS